MSSKSKLGKVPPFDWIKDSRDEEIESQGEKTLEDVNNVSNVKNQHIKKLKSGRPMVLSKTTKTLSEAGLSEGYTRGTFILKVSTLEALKEKAYEERRTLKDVMQEALDLYLSKRS